MRTAALSRGHSCRGEKFSTHLYLVSRLSMSGAIRLLLQTDVMARTEIIFYFVILIYNSTFVLTLGIVYSPQSSYYHHSGFAKYVGVYQKSTWFFASP